jgi:serine/threonine protein kinase
MFAPEPIGTHRQISLEIRRELEIWRRLNHPNVLPFLGITTGFSPFIALVSQWMPNGTLHQFLLKNNATMTTEFRLQLVRALNSRRSLSNLTDIVAFSL